MIRAREIHLHTGGEEVLIRQSNGVRQGSPDSPTLFSLVNEEAAVAALREAQPPGEAPGTTQGKDSLQNPGPSRRQPSS